MEILDMALNDFGSLVKHLRVKKGWTLEQLGEKAGYTSSFILRIEQKKRNPTLESRLAVLISLEVPDEIIIKYVQQVISNKKGYEKVV
ncbi:helix-turn-helix domain-containing protein [Heyndrickxia faecalis]|uniref:helix-turn-helix domain-containing protein n=1 Tax=Heyndrickxia faecalis TaxID=2824910 RepID=UPI003D21D26C